MNVAETFCLIDVLRYIYDEQNDTLFTFIDLGGKCKWPF